MGILIAGLFLFLGIHLVPVFAGARAGLGKRFGEGPYKGAFSVVAGIGLVLIIYGFGAARAAGSPMVWDPPLWLRHLTMLLMLPVFVLLIATYVPGRIKSVLKHPMLVAVKIWALAHLISNGDVASIVLFGSFLAWAVIDRISVKRRPGTAAVVARGRSALRNDAIAVAGGLVVYVAFLFGLHEVLIGVPILG